MAPSVFEAEADFTTSAPLMMSDGSTSNAKSRPAPSVPRMRPLKVVSVYSGPRPRTLTYWPSPPAVRLMDTPVMWLSESATLSSGKRPSSVALMLSWICAESRLIASARSRLARVPVTTTTASAPWAASRSAEEVGWDAAAAAGAAACAWLLAAWDSRPMAASARTDGRCGTGREFERRLIGGSLWGSAAGVSKLAQSGAQGVGTASVATLEQADEVYVFFRSLSFIVFTYGYRFRYQHNERIPQPQALRRARLPRRAGAVRPPSRDWPPSR